MNNSRSKNRTPPAPKRDAQLVNLTAERIVLGGMIRSQETYFLLCEVVRADQFSEAIHREVFTAIKDIHESDKKLSINLLRGRLPDRFDGGKDTAAYLSVLFADAEGVSALDFVDQVVECWARRNLIEMSEKLASAARNIDSNSSDLVTDAEARLADIGSANSEKATVTLGRLVAQVMDKSQQASRDETFVVGFDTGLQNVDDILGPIRNGRLIVVGGDEKTGKTAFVQGILRRAAHRGKVLMAQGEMSGEDIAVRELANESGISATKIEHGNFNFGEWDMLESAKRNLQNENFLFWGFGGDIRISQLRHRALAEKRRNGIKMLAVDHLLHVQSDHEYEKEYLGIGKVVRGLKSLAVELDIPVIVLTHRTQSSRDRNDPTPYPSDFYGGGAIVRECDALLCLYRKDRWLTLRRPAEARGGSVMEKWEQELERATGKVQLALLAHRHAPFPKIVECAFNGPLTRLEEIDRAA